jgi:hypothetical protein
MGEFQRETASWLVRQPFWLNMATCQKESWLEFREGVTIQHEDILFIRDMERASMEQQDIVEMSRYRWVDLNHEERQSLQEYQGAWEVLGGGQIVAARFANKAGCIGPRKRGCPFAANPRADSQPPSPIRAAITTASSIYFMPKKSQMMIFVRAPATLDRAS